MACNHRSRFSTIAAAAVWSVVAVTAAATDTFVKVYDRVAWYAVQAWDFAVNLVRASVVSPEVRNLPGPAVALIAARQFLLRQVKRERPVVSQRWRMCPSA